MNTQSSHVLPPRVDGFDFGSMANVVTAVGRTGMSGVNLLGTAFLLNRPGMLATASHVVGNSDQGLVIAVKGLNSLHDYQDTGDNSVKTLAATIHAIDPFHDLAILKIDVQFISQLRIGGSDHVAVGSDVTSLGYPHANHGRMVLTRQDTRVGARALIRTGPIKAKHLILNVQARPGQSGSPVFDRNTGVVVAVLVGSYAPNGGGGVRLGDIDPHTLHQTTHAVSSEYIERML